MLQLQKQDRRHHQERGYLHQATNSQSEQLVALGENSSSGPEQLQMLQLKKQAEHCITKGRDNKLRTHKVNSCFGREQPQMLHVGQNSCKSFSCKIGGRALHHQEKVYLHQATNSQLQKPEQLHVKWASAISARAAQNIATIVQCSSLFLDKRTGSHRKSVF